MPVDIGGGQVRQLGGKTARASSCMSRPDGRVPNFWHRLDGFWCKSYDELASDARREGGHT